MRATQLLMEEHEIILKALDVLEAAAAKGSAPDGLIDFLTGFADKHHHHKEEDILFPAMEEAGFPRDAGPVGVMLHEHVQGRALIAAMREPAQFAAAALAYAQLLRAHISKENNVLFHMADQAIPREEQRKVDQAFDDFEAGAVADRVKYEATVTRLAKELL